MKNYWDIKSLEWEGPENEGQGFGATNVVDDAGNPFIEFVCDWGYSGCAPTGGWYLAKKRQDADVRESLTDLERNRLGMYMNDANVEALAKQVKQKKK